jgi:hypothetical protein
MLTYAEGDFGLRTRDVLRQLVVDFKRKVSMRMLPYADVC